MFCLFRSPPTLCLPLSLALGENWGKKEGFSGGYMGGVDRDSRSMIPGTSRSLFFIS